MGTQPSRFIPAPCSAPPISRFSITSRLHFLWLTLYRPVPRLPRSIAREVCDYFPPFEPKLLKATIDDVFSFNPNEKQWEKLFPVSGGLFTKGLKSIVMLDDEHVFVCGGYRKQRTNANREDYEGVFLLTRTSKRRLVDLCISRLFHGIAYDPFSHSVFLFGGNSDSNTTLQSAEQFSLKPETCDLIPEMLSPRAYFQPCLHSRSIILCGGNTDGTSERYDIQTGVYYRLAICTKPGPTISVLTGANIVTFSSVMMPTTERLVVDSKGLMQRWSLASTEVKETVTHDEIGWCPCPAIAVGKVVYLYLGFSSTQTVKEYEV